MVIQTRRAYVLLWTSLAAALTSACAAAPEPLASGSPATAKAELSTSAKGSARDDTAVWFLKEDQILQASSTRFTALVLRSGCNGGVTGQVLAPQIRFSDSEVVVTFTVASDQPPGGDCQMNDLVPYEVDLGELLQGRTLVDGECLPGGEAAATALCNGTSVRFKP
jgi:hypothetical protein